MPRLLIDKIGKSYGRKSVLRDVSLEIPAGLTLLTGPSGSGKSTFLRIIATAERPSRGVLSWDGVPLPGGRTHLRRMLGYGPQSVDLPDDLTAREFAMHMASLKGLDLSTSRAQFVTLAQSIGLGDDIDTRIGAFSGGMRRRLVFAQALLGSPRLLALDEPTAELDRESAAAVSTLILERARTAVVVMTTHLADDLAPSARAVLQVLRGQVSQA